MNFDLLVQTQILGSLTPESLGPLMKTIPWIRETPSPETHPQAVAGEIVESATPQSDSLPIYRSVTGQLQTPGKILLERLSYSHLELLALIEPPLKRTFYEIECIKGGWSVRELKRQIGSLYRENEMQPGDQPPVGILLCTRHNGELVHYALAGMDPNLFVSRYQTQLPDVKELEAFVKKELKHWEEAQA
jgi:hypothetical protein